MAAAATVAVGIALIVSAMLFVFVLHRALLSNVKNSAKARAEEVALLKQKTELPEVLPDSGEKGAVVQVVNGEGEIVAASAQVIRGLRLSKLQPVLGDFRTETRSDLPITGDQKDDPFHVAAFGAQTASGPITVFVALSLDGVHETDVSVRKILQFAFPLLLGLVAVASWFFVGIALRPVEVLRKKVAEIGEGDLALRVPEPAVNDEIGRLARGMNLMLGRLQESSDRERRFVADASHELQSPLAASLADLEVAIAYPDSTDWNHLAKSLTEDNQRMTRLVSDLLFLAKADAGATNVGFGLVDLDDIVRGEARRWQLRTSVGIDVSVKEPVEIWGNAEQLARVVRNLLENASRYATSRVLIELSSSATAATLAVTDDGPGIAVADRERIFERFARLDDSRTRASGGSGLGLSIVREIVDAHSGCIGVEPTSVGARFVMQIPLPSSGPPPS